MFALRVLTINHQKLSHAATAMSTANAELKAPTAAGSGDLGVRPPDAPIT
jgi:hypothetical protein